MENSNSEFKQGIFFCWIDNCNEYSAEAFNYDDFKITGILDTLFSHTDIPNLEDMVLNLVTHYHLDVDVFESIVLKDAFLSTLKLLICEGKISGADATHAKEWYLSDEPKFKVLL